MVCANSTSFDDIVPAAFSASCLERMSKLLSGVRKLVRHVGEELRLIFRGERQLLGLAFELLTRFVDLARAPFDFGVALLQKPRLLLELLVGVLQLHLLALQLGRERLRLHEQLLGAHR